MGVELRVGETTNYVTWVKIIIIIIVISSSSSSKILYFSVPQFPSLSNGGVTFPTFGHCRFNHFFSTQQKVACGLEWDPCF